MSKLDIELHLTALLPKQLQPHEQIELLVNVEEWFTTRAPQLNPTQDEYSPHPHLASVGLILHPAGEPASFVMERDNQLTVRALTSSVGPGYHAHLCDLLRRLGQEFKLTWNKIVDPTHYFDTHKWDLLEEYFLAWLADVADNAKRSNNRTFRLYMPPDCHFVDVKAPLLTRLGPRDESWIAQVEQNPKAGIDILPWWHQGIQADYFLGRALCLMWCSVRWRETLNQEEVALLEEVSFLLQSTFSRDKDAEIPWLEWREILQLLKTEGTLVTTVQQHADSASQRPPIGYRRDRADFFLPGGWRITIPGSFCEIWEDDGSTFLGYDNRRNVRISTTSENSFFKSSPKKILKTLSPDAYPLQYANKKLLSKACLQHIEEDGSKYWALHGLSAVAGQRARFTICYEDEGLRDWAIETWHSLIHN